MRYTRTPARFSQAARHGIAWTVLACSLVALLMAITQTTINIATISDKEKQSAFSLSSRAVPKRQCSAIVNCITKATKTVYFEGNPNYTLALASEFNQAYVGERSPIAFTYPEKESEVSAIVKCAANLKIPIVARGGGNSYAALSIIDQGIVVDMAKFTSITVDAKKRVAVIGAGNWLGRVYVVLEKYGFVLPGGDHPGVGVAGLTLGGGFGLISRQFGLMVDYLTEVRLVDAKGRVRVVNAKTDKQLFWALRGSGSGNFGIVTSFKFNLIPAAGKSLTYQMYWWLNVTDPVARIKIVSNFIEETPKLPKDITCSLYLSSIDNHMSLTVARWNKNFTDGALNNTILGLPAANSTETKVFSSYVDLMLEVWFFRNWTKPAFMDRDQVRSVDAMVATSMYSEADPKSGTPMASNRSDALAHLVNEYLVNSQQFMGTIQLNTWGGAISKVPRKSTSFVHRGNYISYQALASVDKNGTAAPKQFLESWRRSMTPFIIPQAYQCYVDTSLPDRFYYGNENVPILKSIKKRVDPTNVWGYKGGLGGGRKGTCGNGLVGDGVCAAVGHYCMDNGICSNNGTFCSV